MPRTSTARARLVDSASRLIHASTYAGAVVLGCPFGNLALELSTREEVIRDRVRVVFEGYRRYFEGAMLLAKTHNDSRLIDEFAEHALSLIGACPNPVSQEPS